MNNADRIEIPPNANFVEISADWMIACGKGNEARTFPIHSIRGRTPGGAVVVDVVDNNVKWTVILPWRGKFV